MFDEKIIGNESVFAELNLDGHSFFDKVCLVVVGREGRKTSVLFQLFVGAHPLTLSCGLVWRLFIPVVVSKPRANCPVHGFRRKQQLPRCPNFFGDFCLTDCGISVGNNTVYFLPKFGLMNQEKLQAIKMRIIRFNLHLPAPFWPPNGFAGS